MLGYLKTRTQQYKFVMLQELRGILTPPRQVQLT